MDHWIPIAIGIVLLLWANKRRFDRRNEAGVELYSSFYSMLGARSIDALIGLVGFVTFMYGVVTLLV